LAERLCGALEAAAADRRADMQALAGVADGRLPLHVVPRFDHDLHSMADLEAFAIRLAAASDQP
jgi:hypothetical protein